MRAENDLRIVMIGKIRQNKEMFILLAWENLLLGETK